ncbi:MAG: DNA polymerase III subunit delta' [Alphaproteobacteria bacterium]|nr:DNA polymerase III subunit delta' [Alphaproteobacteria bacterium]MCB9928097.1 DNA polymerase III subunit delta' [Alphaproteobacteria bacterium]
MLTPRTNPGLVGHARAEETLLAAVTGGRLPHAWLFLGAKGIGKATLAFRFARFLLAGGAGAPVDEGPGLFGEEPPPTAATAGLAMDPEDPVFRRVAAKGHADLMVLDADSATGRSTTIPAEAVRGLGPFLHQTAGEGGRRVVIVDALDELNPTGANALLKLVEEPPPGAVLLLVAHSMARVLPTIRSRCRLLRLAPLSQEDVRTVLAEQRPTEDPQALADAAALAEGSPGRALALLESDGIAIHQALAQFWRAPARVPAEATTALAGLAGQDAAHFAHFAEGFCRQLVQAARTAGGGPAWDALWSDTLHLLDRTEAVYLDRRQVALNRLTAAAKVG